MQHSWACDSNSAPLPASRPALEQTQRMPAHVAGYMPDIHRLHKVFLVHIYCHVICGLLTAPARRVHFCGT